MIPEESPERKMFHSLPGPRRLRIMIDEMNPSCQGHHREDIHPVVVEDAVDLSRISRLDIVEIEGWNPLRWNIILSLHSQESRFQCDQTAVLIGPFPDLSRWIEEVEVGHLPDL